MIQAAKDLNYIKNFYEFIAVGVNSADFDEKLIRECFEDIIIGMEKRGFHMIQHMRRTQGQKVFCSLVELVDKWTTNQSMTTQYKNGAQNLDLGDLTPSQEFVDAMLSDRDFRSASHAHASANSESDARLGKVEPHAQQDKGESHGQPDNMTPIDVAHHAGSGESGGQTANWSNGASLACPLRGRSRIPSLSIPRALGPSGFHPHASGHPWSARTVCGLIACHMDGPQPLQ
jgi:hypothetical protein